MTPLLRRTAVLVGLLAGTILLAGCGSSIPSPTTSSSPDDSAIPSERASETVETLAPSPLGPLLEGQTETATDIGRIWDTLPGAFPMFPGAERSDEAQDGPSSGVYVVEGGDPETIASWLQDRLEVAAFSTSSVSGPFEDGSFDIDSVGQDPACRVRVVIAPLGSLTFLTTFYGAGCPHA